MSDIYKKIEEYNSNKIPKIFILFDNMIADMLRNKKINLIVTVLFITGRKLNNSHVFITQSYFPKNIRLNSTQFFIMKIPNKRELQQILFNHLDNDFRDFLKSFLNLLENHIFLVIDTTLASNTRLIFSKNLLEKI